MKSIDGLSNWRHVELDVVGSTNTEAMALANTGDAGRVWVTGTKQETGKGRRGRTWVSEPGNLYASLLLIEPAPQDALGTLPLVISLALHKAVLAFAPQLEDRLRIKWPNDLLLDGKKLSGILLEAAPDNSGRLAVVIGCGINCQHYPDNSLYPATSLEEAGFPLEPLTLFPHLAKAMAEELRIWSQGAGFAITRLEWLQRATGIGEHIIARFPDKEIEGKFIDIDRDGYLLLEMKDGDMCQISAADIFFGNSNALGA